MNTVEKKLKENGAALAVTEGDSMYPMLKNGDVVLIKVPQFPLKLFDVPVYRRDGHLTMHRIVDVRNGKYIICGDNRSILEKDVKEDDIIGVLAGYYRGNKLIGLTDSEYAEYLKGLKKNYARRKAADIFARIKRKLKALSKI